MNERIQAFAEQATSIVEMVSSYGYMSSYANFDREKFAELIVRECAKVCRDQPNVYALKADRDNCAIAIEEHFGVEESRTQPDQEAAAFIAAEDKKVASRYGYFPKLHPSEWKD